VKILGLTEEETHVDEGQMNEQGVGIEQCVDTEGAAIPTSDAIPSEMGFHMIRTTPQWILVQYTQQWRSLGWLCDNLLSIRSLI
jgi:hypothetical protein